MGGKRAVSCKLERIGNATAKSINCWPGRCFAMAVRLPYIARGRGVPWLRVRISALPPSAKPRSYGAFAVCRVEFQGPLGG